MKLFLMRHGEAEPYRSDDASRALTVTGRAAVAAKQHLLPDIDTLIVSPYLRALQTADILVGEGLNVRHRRIDERVLPDSPPVAVIEEILADLNGTTLIVAHNPLLSRLVQRLCGDEVIGVQLATADVACLEADAFLPGCAALKWLR